MSQSQPAVSSHELPRLAVVVPVHNEAENVAPLIAEICAALAALPSFEILYVDDGSKDDTLARLHELQKTVPQLRVLRHVTCCGQSAAVASGIKAARAPFIATLDGDGQNDPADIPALLATLEAAADPDLLLVAGWRAKRRDSAVKRFSSRFANGLRARLLKDDTPDTGCGLKVFTRAAFLDMPRFDHMHRFLPALMIRRGGEVVSVRVNHRPRERGVSKYGTLDRALVGISDLLGVIWLQKRGSVPQVEERDS
ncbi:glycosyltransferase family 2 protein [Magnetospira thiophila]